LQLNKSKRLAQAKEILKRTPRNTYSVPVVLPHPDVLILADFISEELSAKKARDVFANMINIDHVKKVMFELESVIEAAKADGKDPADILADRYLLA
jgi:hypothetical protein